MSSFVRHRQSRKRNHNNCSHKRYQHAHASPHSLSLRTDAEKADAAARIQAVYRGNRDRAKVAAMPPPPPPGPTDEELAAAATRIQAVARGNASRRQPKPEPANNDAELEAAAVRIQAITRGRLARNRRPPPPKVKQPNASKWQTNAHACVLCVRAGP